MKSKDGRFEIRRERVDSHDHFYCADYEWSVHDLLSGQVIKTFDESWAAAEASGASDVDFSADGRQLVVTGHDGTIQNLPLPSP
jgi:WD40 repeat protein